MENKVKKLKKLDIGEGEFVANKVLYFYEPELSAERFRKMQELEIELGYGVSYKKMFDGIKKSYELVNEQKFADAAVYLHNLMTSIGDLEQRKSPIMEYCAMFINRADEDRRTVDEKVIADKIKDWEIEGYDYHSFFLLAVNMVRGLKENYLAFIRDISEANENDTTEEEG